ncbi:MAG: histidine phosphatase family protein [Minisyncoccia bacterium]
MNNAYFVLRHGQSRANLAGIILSHLENGKKDDYTLTPLGEEQVRQSVSESKANGMLGPKTIIISSPFSRTLRTAEIAKEILGSEHDFSIDDRLRERWFGDWEQTSDANYANVWTNDSKGLDHADAHVESVHDVQKRVMELFNELEAQYHGETFLLISHGDVLQILLASLQHGAANFHRDIPSLETAEMRKV